MTFSRSTTIAAVAAGVILLTGTGMLVGCGGTDYTATATADQSAQDTPHVYGIDDTAVKAVVNDTFVVQLEDNPSTGYSWKVAPTGDAVVALKGSEFRPGPTSTDGAVGVRGVRRWTYAATAAGTGSLVFDLVPPGKGSVSSQTETFTVDVTQ